MVLGRLEGLPDTSMRVAGDTAPFQGEGEVPGEMRVVLRRGGEACVVRLKGGEEDSCLWRLKSGGGGLGRAAMDELERGNGR